MILELLQQDGFQPKKKTAAEYSSPCPACGGNDRFIINAEKGRYWCRQCNIKGDAIQYLRDFRSMSFKDAAGYVGKPTSSSAGQRIYQAAPTAKRESASTPIVKPPEEWSKRVEHLIEFTNKALLGNQQWLDWLLKERGLTQQTAERFRLGWLEKDYFRARKDYGLPQELKENRKPKKLLIPSGLLIPGPNRVRIRRDNPGEYGKYYVLPGSGNEPLIINSHLGTDVAAAIIVESELDAILLCQELRNEFVIVATGSTSNGPSVELIDSLTRRPFVWIALDSDRAGGKAAWEKWMGLKNAIRTPIPASWGKDHTEAHQNGYDLNLWMEAAYELVMENNTEDVTTGE